MLAHADNKVFLHPGDFYFGDADVHVHTLLGSCISITLWHPKLHIGGMCHFVLPKRPRSKNPTLDGRYGNEAMDLFKREVMVRGTNLSDYHGKIFGGSNMLSSKRVNEEDLIGMRNSEAAMQMLMAEDVDIMVAHVGETGHRRIVFDIQSGDVWVRHETANHHRQASTSGRN